MRKQKTQEEKEKKSLPDFRNWESCRWSAGFLRDLPFFPPLHTGAAPYSPHFTLPRKAVEATRIGDVYGLGSRRGILRDKSSSPLLANHLAYFPGSLEELWVGWGSATRVEAPSTLVAGCLPHALFTGARTSGRCLAPNTCLLLVAPSLRPTTMLLVTGYSLSLQERPQAKRVEKKKKNDRPANGYCGGPHQLHLKAVHGCRGLIVEEATCLPGAGLCNRVLPAVYEDILCNLDVTACTVQPIGGKSKGNESRTSSVGGESPPPLNDDFHRSAKFAFILLASRPDVTSPDHRRNGETYGINVIWSRAPVSNSKYYSHVTCRSVCSEAKYYSASDNKTLDHTVFDTSLRTLAESSPSTVTADNQFAVYIGKFVYNTAEFILQVTELANFSGL
ncbi:hypothetical protein PR048_028135 [Dryococelus australis]|uniref:Uncharacterized protein n=1 Tax=Dryococelus australis TaxID=614101 RepID=A0ABQ9GIE7_9NEOP|nr:hypothetical protein PR048_028135 [Dryococelus australis]